VNSEGDDYPDGLIPDGFNVTLNDNNGACVDDANDNCVNEITIENLQTRPELGDPADPLLERAISLITGQPTSKSPTVQRANMMQEVDILKNNSGLRKYRQEMYVEPFMMPKPTKN
jgi:hypothetical protein